MSKVSHLMSIQRFVLRDEFMEICCLQIRATSVRSYRCGKKRTFSASPVTDFGRFVEWHLVLFKSFEDITFDLVPGLHHAVVFLLSAFSEARFKAIGAVGNSMRCDSIEQLFV